MSHCRLIVKNLAKNVGDEQLREAFSKHGEITDCRVIRDKKTKESRRFAFIGFRDDVSAMRAQKYLDKSFIGTCKVSVEQAAALGIAPLCKVESKTVNPHTELAIKPPKGREERASDALSTFIDAMTHKKGQKVWADDSVTGDASKLDASDKEDDVNDIVLPSKDAPPSAFNSAIDDLGYLKQHVVSGWDSEAENESEEELNSPISTPSANIHNDDSTADMINSLPAEKTGSDGILDSGRIRVLNLPYTSTKESVESYFSVYGPVREVHICRDDDTKRSKGYAFVTFVFPEHAVKALSSASTRGVTFEGRILRIEEARGFSGRVLDMANQNKSFKQRREDEKRQNAHKQENTWNLLYVSGNAVAASMADTLGVSKADLMDIHGENDDLAIRVAIGETEIVRKTAEWLKSEGVRINAFERKGESLINAQSVSCTRSKSIVIIKHLPPGEVDVEELRQMFSRFGELIRFSMAPSKTVALTQFCDETAALKAFTSLSFRRYRTVPLYLEWAPEDIFITSCAGTADAPTPVVAEQDEVDVDSTSLFVKNIDFSSTEDSLARIFKPCKGFLKFTLMLKTTPNGTRQSMGYGFVEFANQRDAGNALKKLQGTNVDGKSLQISVSASKTKQVTSLGSQAVDIIDSTAISKATSTRLCVKNIPFESNRIEIKKLFHAYGNVVSVRMPLKTGERQHRGFAFVEFLSRADAMRAMEALQHTHIYGRKLVIEAAEADSIAVDDLRAKTAKRALLREGTLVSESKRRKISSKIES